MAETFDDFLKSQGITSTQRMSEGETVTDYYKGQNTDRNPRRLRGSQMRELRQEFSRREKTPVEAPQAAPVADAAPATNELPALREPRPLTFDENSRIRDRRDRRAILQEAQIQQVFDFQQPEALALPGNDLLSRLFGKADVMKGFV